MPIDLNIKVTAQNALETFLGAYNPADAGLIDLFFKYLLENIDANTSPGKTPEGAASFTCNINGSIVNLIVIGDEVWLKSGTDTDPGYEYLGRLELEVKRTKNSGRKKATEQQEETPVSKQGKLAAADSSFCDETSQSCLPLEITRVDEQNALINGAKLFSEEPPPICRTPADDKRALREIEAERSVKEAPKPVVVAEKAEETVVCAEEKCVTVPPVPEDVPAGAPPDTAPVAATEPAHETEDVGVNLENNESAPPAVAVATPPNPNEAGTAAVPIIDAKADVVSGASGPELASLSAMPVPGCAEFISSFVVPNIDYRPVAEIAFHGAAVLCGGANLTPSEFAAVIAAERLAVATLSDKIREDITKRVSKLEADVKQARDAVEKIISAAIPSPEGLPHENSSAAFVDGKGNRIKFEGAGNIFTALGAAAVLDDNEDTMAIALARAGIGCYPPITYILGMINGPAAGELKRPEILPRVQLTQSDQNPRDGQKNGKKDGRGGQNPQDEDQYALPS